MTTAVKETGLLMNGPMVRATLANLKRQTRRLDGLEEVNHAPNEWMLHKVGILDQYVKPNARGRFGAYFHREVGREIQILPVACRFGGPGDLMWVRETWRIGTDEDCACYEVCDRCVIGRPMYAANYDTEASEWGPWKPSIHMPRRLSRITLEVNDVRVERVQDISEEDALAEGCPGENVCWKSPYIVGPHTDDGLLPSEQFAELWDSINGNRSGCSWADNPWVWAISFTRT